jgi:hypothetical protein
MNAIKFKKRTLFVNTQTTIQKKTHTHTLSSIFNRNKTNKKEKDHRIKSEEETCRFTLKNMLLFFFLQ